MNKIEETALKLAWKKGTSKSKYAYKGGKPTKEYIAAYKKIFGKYSREKSSNCDRSIALVARIATAEKKYPTGNEDQLKYKPKKIKRKVYKNVRPIDVSKPGQLIVYKKKNGRHSVIRVKGGICQAQHHKTFFHFLGSLKKLKTKRSKVAIFYI